MSGDSRANLVGLNRFGLGPRPGDLARVGRDARGLFLSEIAEKRLTPLPAMALPGSREAGSALRAFQEAERMAREARAARPAPSMTDMAAADGARSGQASSAAPAAPALPPAAIAARSAEPPFPAQTYRDEVRARFHAMLDPLGGLPERLVAFWSNHFAVSVAKGAGVRVFAGLMEREAIRPHVFGRFADMLLAVETHPAMVLYLDQQQSLGPNSPAGARRGRGLNENLAREILELHTLGVAGGYGQADVAALARIITGWTLVPANATDAPPGIFRFNGNMHEPGPHALLGKTYPEGGFEQGKAALEDLARHRSTAGHIARKLARHFVADDPPPALIARLASVFLKSDGDLQAVSAALVAAPEAWSAPAAKMRSPQEFLVASARALGRRPDVGQILQPLNAMGHPIWQPSGPNGFPDTVAAWASPEGLKTRLDVSAAIARQAASGIDVARFLGDVFGDSISPETKQAVLRAESRYQAVAIALMSPEFQRR